MTPLTEEDHVQKEYILDNIRADLADKIARRDDLNRAINTLTIAEEHALDECNAYLFSNRGTE